MGIWWGFFIRLTDKSIPPCSQVMFRDFGSRLKFFPPFVYSVTRGLVCGDPVLTLVANLGLGPPSGDTSETGR